MSATTLTPAKTPQRRSPNRQRMIARVWVWSIGLTGAAFIVPHIIR